MSSSSTPPNNPYVELTNAIKALKESIDRRQNKSVDRNTKTLQDLNASFTAWGNLTSKFRESFARADRTQVKALATGTTLAKFTSENSEVLKRMRGDFFENATELLKNFESGLREDSESLVALTNEMYYTGQSTDILRTVMSELSMVTGGNIKAISELSDVNVETSRKYLISNEKLFSVVAELSSNIRRASLVAGGGENLAKFSTMLAGEVGAANLQNIKPFVDLLMSSDQMQARSLLGLEDIQMGILEGNLSMSEVRNSIKQAAERLTNITGELTDNMSFNRMQKILETIGNPDQLLALLHMSRSFDKQVVNTDAMRREAMDAFENQKSVEGLAREFYNQSLKEVYPLLLDVLPGLMVGSQLINAGGLFKGLEGGGLKNLFKIGALYSTGFLLGSFILPFIGEAMRTPTDSEREREKYLKSLDRKTKDQNAVSKKESRTSLGEIISENLKKGLINSEASKREMARGNDKVVELLRELIKISKNNKNSIPQIERGNGK